MVDLTPTVPSGQTTPVDRLFAYEWNDIDGGKDCRGANKEDVTCLGEWLTIAKGTGGLLARAEAAANALALARRHKDSSTTRLVTGKGDALWVAVAHPVLIFSEAKKDPKDELVVGAKPKLTWEEVARRSRIQSDLTSLIDLVLDVSAVARSLAGRLPSFDPSEDPALWMSVTETTLMMTRATLTVSAESPAGPAVVVASAGDAEAVTRRQVWKFDRLQETACAAPAGREPISRTPIALLSCQAAIALRDSNQAALVRAISALRATRDRAGAPTLAWLLTKSDTQVPPETKAAIVSALGDLTEGETQAFETVVAQPKQTAQFITGPSEHWFLSAAAGLRRAGDFDVNADGIVDVRNRPGEFYVGVNMMPFGDLQNQNRSIWQSLYVGILVKASKKPLDAWGAAIGLAGNQLKAYGLNFDVVSPFVGAINVAADEPRRWQFAWGVNVNVDRGLAWLKGQ